MYGIVTTERGGGGRGFFRGLGTTYFACYHLWVVMYIAEAMCSLMSFSMCFPYITNYDFQQLLVYINWDDKPMPT